MRKEVERVIKEQGLARSRAFEVSKMSYAGILKKIQDTFVYHGGDMHWSNMGYLKPQLCCKYIPIHGQRLWYHALPQILPAPEEPVYTLFEDTQNYQAKYWLYEMYLPELITILDEVNGLDDFYIVSKKYDWLLSENHEDIVACIGAALNLAEFPVA